MVKTKNWDIWLLLLLVPMYLIQLPTPLRVNTDGVIYLSLAASFNDGHGFIWHHHKSHFPSGYPAIVARLERVGLASSSGLIAWNYLMMAVGIRSAIWLLDRWLNIPRTTGVLISLLYLMSWATIRYALIPGSEMTYIGLSLLCLQCLTVAETETTNAAWMWWIAAAILAPLAMSVRLVGVVLGPAILWALVLMFWRRRRVPQISFGEWARKYRGLLVLFGIIAVMVGGVVAWAVTRTSYFREDWSLMTSHGLVREFIFTMKQRLLELGSMVLNIPSKNVLVKLQGFLMRAGVACLVIVVIVLVRRIRSLTSIDVYLIGYTALLMVWPYNADVRFWLPVQVLLFGLLYRELMDLLSHSRGMAKPLLIGLASWLIVFEILGCASIAWNTRLTYSGDRFSERWDIYTFRDTYRLASRNGLPVDPKAVNEELLAVLKRYGGRNFNK